MGFDNYLYHLTMAPKGTEHSLPPCYPQKFPCASLQPITLLLQLLPDFYHHELVLSVLGFHVNGTI